MDVANEDGGNATNKNIEHLCIACPPMMRSDTIADLCRTRAGAYGKTIIFTDTKAEADELAQSPALVNMGAMGLHGDIPQTTREKIMESYRSGHVRVLVATDVAARGLDVPNVDLVIMTHPPMAPDTYVHRAGRTARGGKSGTVVVFYSFVESYALSQIKWPKSLRSA